MVSPLGDQSQFPDSIYQSIRSHFQDDLAAYLDVQQLFILIDGVLPFEACLYYQVLPLYVDSDRLILGMVNPYDSAAMDYVRRIISYHKYRPIAHTISSEALQAVLSAYLSYSGSQASQKTGSGFSQKSRSPYSSSKSRSKQPHLDHNAQPTYIVDSPEDLNLELPGEFLATLSETSASLPQYSIDPSERTTVLTNDVPDTPVPAAPLPFQADQLDPLEPLDPLDLSELPEPNPSAPLEPTQPIGAVALPMGLVDGQGQQAEAQPLENLQTDAQQHSPAVNSLGISEAEYVPRDPHASEMPSALLQPIPPLKVRLNHLNEPIESLANLPPPVFLQELLGRVLVAGIGRLYFERQHRHGRILWSQNGVLQSVLERLDLQQFQGIINELKLLAHLSLLPITQSRQTETERLYNHTRILLRFRFSSTVSGEEATVQILRGAALKFYQQQQVVSLERDALGIARQLQTKLNEIRDRARSESGDASMRLDVLPALSQILKNIEEQVDHMQPESDPSSPN